MKGNTVLNSSFFLNWCNVNPNKITKWDQLWFRKFVSIILNPFLRVFAISAFLKVINAPKTPKFRYPEINLPTYIFSNPPNQNFAQETLDLRVFLYLMGSPDCEDLKEYM